MRGNKMALANIRERLALHFDAEASLESRVTKDGLRSAHPHSVPYLRPAESVPADRRPPIVIAARRRRREDHSDPTAPTRTAGRAIPEVARA